MAYIDLVRQAQPQQRAKQVLVSTEVTQSSGLFEAVAVSSDSKKILDISKSSGADFCILRPQEMASDQSPKLPAIQHCVNEVEILSGKKFDVIVDTNLKSTKVDC